MNKSIGQKVIDGLNEFKRKLESGERIDVVTWERNQIGELSWTKSKSLLKDKKAHE